MSKSQSLSYVGWLHYQAINDKKREMPYAGIYKLGREIERVLGADGIYDLERLLAEIPDANQHLDLFIQSEAAWRVDTLCHEHPEEVQSKVDYVEAKALAVVHIKCGFRDTGGRGCTNESVPGAVRCEKHGGAITDPEVRKSLLLIAYAAIVQGAVVGAEALLDVAANSVNDMARVKAAEALLDRGGLIVEQSIQIHTEAEVDTDAPERLLEMMKKQMNLTRERMKLELVPMVSLPTVTFENTEPGSPVQILPSSDDDVIDAEIVE